MTTSILFRRVRLFSTAIGALSLAVAQTVPPPAPATNQSAVGDEPVELSPFVISESAETGWIATETLAGSRLRTNFKDVPNQIETLTKDFMADLALNNMDQALIYTANVENHSDYVTYVASNPLNDPGGAARVRGIGSGTLTRNFFKVKNPTDNFNIDRATIASGPNAILFGLGSPAGILDATPARALMRNRYGFTVQYDSEESRRGTFDANFEVLKDKLALRLMGMSQREFTHKKPNLDRDDRIYGTVTFKPFKNTTIIFQGERDNRNASKAPRMTPGDNVTLWFKANEIPGSGYSVPRPVFNNSNLAGIGNNVIFTQLGDVPVLVSGGSGRFQSFRQSVNVKNPRQLPGVNQTYDADTEWTILDPNVFPFDMYMLGTGRTTVLGGYTKTVIIEQKFTPNLFLELAYNHENAYSHRQNAIGGGSGDFINLHVDPNQFIAGTTTPNPNLGKFYYQGTAQNIPSFYTNEEWRATLSYDFDAGRKFADRSWWGKFLGRHRLSGLYTGAYREAKSQQGWVRRILDDPAIAGFTLRPKTFRNWATHASRAPQFRHYFDSPTDATTPPGPFTGDWIVNDSNGEPFPLYMHDTPLVAADGKRLGAGTSASGVKNRNWAYILAWQGFFLPDGEGQSRLVVTYGYRKDTAKTATLDPSSTMQDFSGLYPSLWDVTYGPFGESQSGINRNIGVVVRPLKWLSLFYNQSTSFDLNIGRFDPFGHEYPGAGGDGKDYGVRFDLWGDKVTLRVNKYENALGPQRATNQINDPARNVMWNIERRVRELDPSLPTINVTDGNRLGYRNAGRPNYWIMSNFESTGYEVELNVTPTRNWNIRVNGSKSEAIESDLGAPWFAWVAAREPVWKSVVATNGEVDASGQPVTFATAPFNVANPTGQTLQQYYERDLVAQSLAFIKAVDGRATDTARPARANLITNYRFSAGRLRGVNFGGAARWRSAPTVGYGVKEGAAGPELDLDQTFRGKRELYFDAFVGYRGRMEAFGGFNYRLQLNVRNLLNEDDPIAVTKTTTGQVVRIATVEPRLFVLSFGVDF